MSLFRAAAALGLAGALVLTLVPASAQEPGPFELLPYGGFDDLYDYDDYIEPPEEPTVPVEQAAPDRAELLAELYQSLSAAEDAQRAGAVVEAIEKVWLRSGSDTVDLLMGRALKMVDEKELDVALKLLDAVVDIDPEYPEGWNQRASVHFLKRDYGRSLQDLRSVLRLDPQHFKAISGLAVIFRELGETESALTAFRKALEVHPHLEDARRAVRELAREVEGQGI